MIVTRRNKMPNGIDVQQEDWSVNYKFYAPNSTIAVYPIAMKINKDKFIVNGEKFRLDLQFDNEEQANQCYESLLKGTAKISDYKYHGNKELFELIGE